MDAGRKRLSCIKRAVAIQATERLLVIYETIPPFSQKSENTPLYARRARVGGRAGLAPAAFYIKYFSTFTLHYYPPTRIAGLTLHNKNAKRCFTKNTHFKILAIIGKKC